VNAAQHQKPWGEAWPCVCCGEPGQTGRYDGMPCCVACYETGLLGEWLALADSPAAVETADAQPAPKP
jgi:hypothetical protein